MQPSLNTAWLMIVGGDVILPDAKVLAGGTVVIHPSGRIHEVSPEPPASLFVDGGEVKIVDATGCWVSPGLIDQHLHGALGVDFNQSSVEEMQRLLGLLPQLGITSIVPTIISASKVDMVVALSRLEELITTVEAHHAHILGLHLEGPFLSPQYRGAHPTSALLKPTLSELEGFLSPSLKRVTMAPELDDGLAVLDHLISQGVQVSLGHSGASFDIASRAYDQGARSATHLYNAMAPLHHRESGLAMASLLDDRVYVELIGDGHHLSAQMLQMTLKTKPLDKAVLISDCNVLTGMPPGSTHTFGKQTITVDDALKCVNEEGRLAGSSMLLTDCVRNLVHWGVTTLPHAVSMASTNPARCLEESQHFGGLDAGCYGDVLLWNKDDLSLRQVVLNGHALDMLATTTQVVA